MNLLVDLPFVKILFGRIVGMPNHPAPVAQRNSIATACLVASTRYDRVPAASGPLTPRIVPFALLLRAVSAAISTDPAPFVRDN
jgi:hypothetical protein